MSSRYVPPHLRHDAQQDALSDSQVNQSVVEEQPVARRRLSELKISDDVEPPLYTLHELNKHYGSKLIDSTLRDTSENPDQLGYVVLFRGANPRWKVDHILFAHTNIHLLPGYEAFKQRLKSEKAADEEAHASDVSIDQSAQIEDNVEQISTSTAASEESRLSTTLDDAVTPTSTQLPHSKQEAGNVIPVFMQVSGNQSGRSFLFHGYFHFKRVDFLEPHSPELMRMLQQKFEPTTRRFRARKTERNPEAWAKSLSQEWAVVQFDDLPKDKNSNDPIIPVLPEKEQGSIEGVGSQEQQQGSEHTTATGTVASTEEQDAI